MAVAGVPGKVRARAVHGSVGGPGKERLEPTRAVIPAPHTPRTPHTPCSIQLIQLHDTRTPLSLPYCVLLLPPAILPVSFLHGGTYLRCDWPHKPGSVGCVPKGVYTMLGIRPSALLGLKVNSSCCPLRPHTTPFTEEKSIPGVIYGAKGSVHNAEDVFGAVEQHPPHRRTVVPKPPIRSYLEYR